LILSLEIQGTSAIELASMIRQPANDQTRFRPHRSE
jgi:hypothetical protein